MHSQIANGRCCRGRQVQNNDQECADEQKQQSLTQKCGCDTNCAKPHTAQKNQIMVQSVETIQTRGGCSKNRSTSGGTAGGLAGTNCAVEPVGTNACRSCKQKVKRCVCLTIAHTLTFVFECTNLLLQTQICFFTHKSAITDTCLTIAIRICFFRHKFALSNTHLLLKHTFAFSNTNLLCQPQIRNH